MALNIGDVVSVNVCMMFDSGRTIGRFKRSSGFTLWWLVDVPPDLPANLFINSVDWQQQYSNSRLYGCFGTNTINSVDATARSDRVSMGNQIRGILGFSLDRSIEPSQTRNLLLLIL